MSDESDPRPCLADCPKCGYGKTTGTHMMPGTYSARLGASRHKDEYMERNSLIVTVHKEHVRIRCQFCKYEWGVPPMDAEEQGEETC